MLWGHSYRQYVVAMSYCHQNTSTRNMLLLRHYATTVSAICHCYVTVTRTLLSEIWLCCVLFLPLSAVCHCYVLLLPEDLYQQCKIAVSSVNICISNTYLPLHFVTIIFVSAIWHSYVPPLTLVLAIYHSYVPLLPLVSAMSLLCRSVIRTHISNTVLLLSPVTFILFWAILDCGVVLSAILLYLQQTCVCNYVTNIIVCTVSSITAATTTDCHKQSLKHPNAENPYTLRPHTQANEH